MYLIKGSGTLQVQSGERSYTTIQYHRGTINVGENAENAGSKTRGSKKIPETKYTETVILRKNKPKITTLKNDWGNKIKENSQG